MVRFHGAPLLEDKMAHGTRHRVLEKVKLENSDETIMAHHAHKCKAQGEVCCLHNRTEHSMRSYPQHWRGDRRIMERICKCGVGHPDPDDKRVLSGEDSGIHGCCGCCRELA